MKANNNFTNFIGKVKFTMKKHSPEILLYSGIAGFIVSGVLACVATTKLDKKVTEMKDNVEDVHKTVSVSKEQYNKELTKAYVKGILGIAKIYAPAITTATVSTVCVLASHNIIKKRNVALAAAYTTLDRSFKEYRSKIIDKFGEDADKEAVEYARDEMNKEEKDNKKLQNINNFNFDRLFDEYNNQWTRDAGLNHFFLSSCEKLANKKLRDQGYLFLNDVLEMLNFNKIPQGQLFGWISRDENGFDHYVDFGYSDDKQFMDEEEPSVWLHFNVDGNILDKM